MSAFANVYVGAAPNDLTGDTLRQAFEIINTNFANIESGTANITVNAPVRSVAGRTGNVSLYVNDVMGAASLANVIAQTNAANVYANVLYATTTSAIAANVYSQVEANLASNIASVAEGLVTSGNLLDPIYADIDLINANAVATNSDIADINTHLVGTDYQVTTLIAGNIATQANLGTAVNNISALVSNSATQGSQLDSLVANSIVQHNQIRTLDANLGVVSANIVNLQSNTTQQENTLITLTANAALQTIRLNTLESNAATQGGQIRTIDANLGVLSTTYIALTANAAVQTVELAALISNSATQGTQLNSINANLGSVVDNISTIETEISSLSSSISQVSALESNVATQAARLQLLDANLGATTTTVALQLTSINSLRANITAANAAIVSANSAVVAYTNDLHASQQSNITLVSLALATTNANLGAATINVANLQANAITQQTDIISLRANITAGNTALATYISSNDTALAATNTEVGKLRANITAANAAIVTANTSMKTYVDDRITTTAFGNTQVSAYLKTNTGNINAGVMTAVTYLGDGSQLSNMYGNTQVFGFLQTYTPQQVGNITANGIALFDALNTAPTIITMFNDGNINAGNIILRDNFYADRGIVDSILVGNIEITNNISFAGFVTGNAVGSTSTYDLYYVNSGGGIYSDGYFFANGDPFVAPAITGNITFTDTTISTDTGSGIILNSAGAGEIAMQDYVGINNLNPGYWLHIGDGSPGAVQNTGNVSIDFNNGTDAARGSTILDYAWWENSNGNDNRGTGDHIHVGLYKNDDSHDNPFIEFDYVSGNATVGNLTVTSIAYTMANAANWDTAPTTIAAALDELAQRLRDAGF